MQTLKPEQPVVNERGTKSLNPADLSFSSQGNNWRNIRLIIGREYNARVRRRIFVFSTIALILTVVAGAFIPTIIQAFSSNSPTKIVVVDSSGGSIAGQNVINYLDQTLNTNNASAGGISVPTTAAYSITPTTAAQSENARQEVRDGKLDALLTVSRNPSGELVFDYFNKSSSDVTGAARVRQALTVLAINDRLARAGLPQSQLAQLFSPPTINTSSVSQEKSSNQGKSGEEQAASYLIAFVLVVLLFSMFNIYGTAVAQGAAEEKSNRVMEIMVSAATPFQLMMGKVLGIGLAGFTQMLIVAVAGVVAFLVQSPIKAALLGGKTGGTEIDVTKVSVLALVFFVVFFVLGFLLWASLYAAVGSLVSRQEDVQGAIAPLSFLNIFAYIGIVFGLQGIDATWVTVLSYVPFFTPMMMFGRLALGAATWWEGLIGVAILLVSIVVFTWLSSRVYRAGVLMYGSKPNTRQILKLMFSRSR